MRGRVRDFLDTLPPGTGEVAAVLLIVFGVVSLLALLNFSPDATLTGSWAQAIRQLFGFGSFVVALGILALGVILLLPQFGIVLRFPWPRILALEVGFLSLLALLHLLSNDPEPRALARAGGGGGYVGWAFSQMIAGLFDPITATLVYGIVFVFAVSRAIGLRWQHLDQALEWGISRLSHTAETLEQRAERLSKEAEEAAQAEAAPRPDAPYLRQRPSVVNRSNQPAGRSHVRPLWTQGDEADLDDEDEDDGDDLYASGLPSYIQPDPDKLDRGLSSPGPPGERPSIVPRTNGEGGGKAAVAVPMHKPTTRARQVRDAHGRMVREFRVEDLQEERRVGRRDDGLPPYDLLDDNDLNRPTDEEINTNARIIEDTLQEFDIHVEVVDVKIGPVVTQYAVQPFKEMVMEDGERYLQRVRVNRITTLENDLAMALSAQRLRIQAPVPGHSYIGVEVPNKQPSIVSLRGVMESVNFYRARKSPLALPLGRDVSGESFITDLSMMPHLLIAGTTGSGKSIMLAAMTTSLVVNNPPDRVKLVLLDPKMVELSRFNGLPHLLGPVETELDRIIGVLRWATREMDFRYKLLEKEAARNIETYNRALGRRRKDERLPYIAIIIDEIGDLMMQRPDETERALTRLAQMARAVGIHLMVATQRPSVDVITGLIKANFPARISFAVASGIDSRVILDHTGAETLMGRGDMLFLAPDAAGPQRIQGCYISDEEVNAVVTYWKEWYAAEVEAERIEPLGIAPWERGMTRREVLAETDPMLEEAISLVVAEREASASLIQRRLGLGYPRAARLIDLMHELGVVGPARAGGRTREVLVKPGSDPFKKLIDKRLQNKQ